MSEHKVALVAGASPGFGSALCERLLEGGYRVAALGREPALAALRRTVAVEVCVSTDMTDPAQTNQAFSEVESALGPVTAVVVNAARLVLAPSLRTDVKAFSECLNTNCLSAFVVAQRCIPGFLKRGGGALVFTGATASLRGGKQSAAFADELGAPHSGLVPLFRDEREDVRIEIWSANAPLAHFEAERGLELFVLEGSFARGGESFVKHSWLRLPAGEALIATAGEHGVKLWAKYTYSQTSG